MGNQLYPLLFMPLWQGPSPQLQPDQTTFFDENALQTPADGPTETCWLLHDADNAQTRVANGQLEGTTLRELTAANPRHLVGRKHGAENAFPLHVRLYSPSQQTPLLVHPAPDSAVNKTTGAFNAKFWNMLACERSASVFLGLGPRASAQQLLGQLDTPDAQRYLQKFNTREGDSYLIPPGIAYSLGTGITVLEIQTTTAEPLRLSTWDESAPIDPEEQQRAAEALQTESRQTTRTPKAKGTITHTRRMPLAPRFPFFSVEEIRIRDHIVLETDGEACHLLVALAGDTEVKVSGKSHLVLEPTMLCCIPATTGQYQLVATNTPTEILRISTQSLR